MRLGSIGCTFRQNYRHTPLGHTWSLAVEEHFYLALPVALVIGLRFEAAPRERLRFIPFLALAVGILCFWLRLRTHGDLRSLLWFWTFGTPTHLRMDSLAFGILQGYVFHYQPTLWNRLTRPTGLWLLISFAFLLPVLVLSRQSHFSLTWGFTFAYLGFGALLIACVGSQISDPARGDFWIR